jgi:hypothetical protein
VKDIVVSGQPTVAGAPKGGTPVTADQFVLDFDVTVDSDGCYIADFRLTASYTSASVGGAPDALPSIVVITDTVLSDSTDPITPLCLSKGTTHFRVTPGAAAPAGTAAPPAPPAGTQIITVNGSWPNATGKLIRLSYVIDVYRFGRCVNGKCETVKRGDLRKKGCYLEYEGPRKAASGGGTEVAPLDRTLATRVLEAPHRDSEMLAQLTRSTPYSVTTKNGTYTLSYARELQTFNQLGILIEWRPAPGKKEPPASFVVKPTWPNLRAAARALVRLESSLGFNRPATIADNALGFIPHGFLSFEFEGSRMMTPFLEGRPVFGLIRPADLNLALVTDLLDSFLKLLNDDDEQDADGTPVDEVVVWVKSKVKGQGFWHAAGEVFAYIWAYGLGWSVFGPDGIIDGVDDLVKGLNLFAAHRRCIEELHIKGHGGSRPGASQTGAIAGSFILIGENATLESADFDDDGNIQSNAHAQDTQKVLDALKAALCPGGKLIFSACDQKVGGLLEHISKYIDNGITVGGYSDLGVPWGEGDMKFVDGVAK